MFDDAVKEALRLALGGRWKEAVQVNLKMLKGDLHNVDTLNRLGRAYLETGQKTRARQTYEKVLKIEKYNSIALKNLELIKSVRIDRGKKSGSQPPIVSPPLFLEEPGVTKTISLVRLGDPKVIAGLHPADEVVIVSRQHNVVALTTNHHYIGRLPDDLAARLRTFIHAGNTYAAWIRSVEPLSNNSDQGFVRLFIKEIKRVPKYRHTPSFPLTEKLTYAAFTPPELVHEEKPDVSATEFQEDDYPTGSAAETEAEPAG